MDTIREILEEGEVALLLKDDGSRSAVRAILADGKILRTKFTADSVEKAVKSKDFMHSKASYLEALGNRVVEIVSYPVVASEATHTISLDGNTIEITDEQFKALQGITNA